jgi:hypothetical protein
MSLMLWGIISYSQPTQTPFLNKIIVIDGDTNFIVPNWRLKEANKKFITLDLANETISSLESLIKEWSAKSDLQAKQIIDLKKIIENKDNEIQALNGKLDLKTQEMQLGDDKLKYYKKKGRVLKAALGISIIGLIGVTTLAIIN